MLSHSDSGKRISIKSVGTFGITPKPPDTAHGVLVYRIEHPGIRKSGISENQFKKTHSVGIPDTANPLRSIGRTGQLAIGKTEEILIEGKSATAPDVLTGRTNSNRLVNFRIPEGIELNGMKIDSSAPDFDADEFEGMLANVRITRAKPYSVEGELESFIDESR